MSHSLLNIIVIIISIYKGGVFTRKFIKNHHIVVTSLVKHTLPSSPIPEHLEFT